MFSETRRALKVRRFKRSGLKPWTKGYVEHRQDEMSRVLRAGEFRPEKLPPGYGFRLDERIIEYPWLFARLPAGSGSLLDAGSILNFEFLLDLPVLKGKRLHICTLAPESDCFWQRGISYVYDDLRKLPYRDGMFDWVVCLSTLEHVGMDNTMLYTSDSSKREAQSGDYLVALRELRRVLKSGGSAYLSMPFGKAANLGWYQVFDQKMIESVVGAFEPASFTINYFQYYPDGWRSSSAQEAANATVFDIHHAKGYDSDFAAAARAVCCVELKK